MRHVNISYSGGSLDYRTASRLAAALAANDQALHSPEVMAWHDKPGGRMSPAIAGADLNSRWHDYGESHNGELEVSVNGEYDFIFADASAFASYGPSPYVNLHDESGREYICQLTALRDRRHPDEMACMPVDEFTSKMT